MGHVHQVEIVQDKPNSSALNKHKVVHKYIYMYIFMYTNSKLLTGLFSITMHNGETVCVRGEVKHHYGNDLKVFRKD